MNRFIKANQLFFVLVLGLVLRIINLNQSFWLDEATSVLVARDFSFSEILSKFSPGDFHPPLYYLMLKGWISIFGASELAARLLSVLAGVATVYLVYLVGKKLFDEKVGLVAALFMSSAPLHIYYSQEARMYVPATFLGTAAVWFLIKVLRKKNFLNWIGLVIFSLLALFTEYVLVFLFAFFALWLLFFEKTHLRKYANLWVGVTVAGFMAFLPWLPTFWQQLQGGLGVKTSVPGWWQVLGRTNLKELALVPIKFMIGRISAFNKLFYAATLVMPTVLFGGLFLKAAYLWQKTKFVWLWLLVPIATAAIAGFWLSLFSYFRLIFVLPAFYLLLAAAAFSLKKMWREWIIAGVLVINLLSGGIYLFIPRFHREDWRSAVAFIEESSKGENAVTVFVSNGQQEAYKYYRKSVPSFGPEVLDWGSFDTIWLMRYVQPIFDPEELVQKKVEEDYKKIGEHDFNGVVVWEYQK